MWRCDQLAGYWYGSMWLYGQLLPYAFLVKKIDTTPTKDIDAETWCAEVTVPTSQLRLRLWYLFAPPEQASFSMEQHRGGPDSENSSQPSGER